MSEKPTSLQRLRDAAERIRVQYKAALEKDDAKGLGLARDAAERLGLLIRYNFKTGEVRVTRANGEEA